MENHNWQTWPSRSSLGTNFVGSFQENNLNPSLPQLLEGELSRNTLREWSAAMNLFKVDADTHLKALHSETHRSRRHIGGAVEGLLAEKAAHLCTFYIPGVLKLNWHWKPAKLSNMLALGIDELGAVHPEWVLACKNSYCCRSGMEPNISFFFFFFFFFGLSVTQITQNSAYV